MNGRSKTILPKKAIKIKRNSKRWEENSMPIIN
jgi:hypothetical protein